MRLVVFGLSVSSSWGNGHAALWRGLIGALTAQGHQVTFFERDVPYYAEHRDLAELPGGTLRLYKDWAAVRGAARQAIRESDVAIVTSYCPDGIAATDLVSEGRALRCFYDLDTPVTLAALESGQQVPYIGPEGLSAFDLVLSYTGGQALDALQTRLFARRVTALYGWADPVAYRATAPVPHYAAALSYLGTYAGDRQEALERLFVEPARLRPSDRFVIGGALYPQTFPWTDNMFFVRHLPPTEHRAFYSSARLTLNVTRAAMARMGWCPSGRLFEAACCGTPILTDRWEGLDTFFEPGREIIVADTTEQALAALDLGDEALDGIARRARDRVLGEHTSAHRATSLIDLLQHASTASV